MPSKFFDNVYSIATMQCPQREPALLVHIVNFPCKGAPILCKFLYINDQFALENKVIHILF